MEDRGYATPCWIFKHVRKQPSAGVYSRPVINGKRVAAHRFMYEQEIGPIPAEMTIDHLCAQHGCIRPDHLEPVSLPENVRRYHRRRRKELTPDEIREIRSAPTGYGSGQPLVRKFGVSESLISQIRAGKIYKDVI